MKKEIKMFIIGILVGAIVTAGIFMLIKPGNSRNMPDFDKFGQFDKDGEGFDPDKIPSRGDRSKKGDREKKDESSNQEEKVNENQD